MADYTGSATLGASPGRTQTDNTQSGGLVGKVREQATSQLNTQKDRATEGLGSVAHAVRETTQRLRDEKHDTVARYAEQAADQIERFSERLRNKDVGELVSDAQQLARRQPALFVGGAFALGLLGARFMKSSARDEYDYPTSGGSGRSLQTVGSASSTGAYGNQLGSTGANAYGNQVPSSATSAGSSSTRRTTPGAGRDYPSTEGL